MVRLFLTSSHLSSISAALIAKQFNRSGDKNYLLIDHYGKKASLVHLINQSNEIFPWDGVIDFSYHLSNKQDLNPGLKKRILRKLKVLPLISDVYDYFLRHHTKSYVVEMCDVVKGKIELAEVKDCDEIYFLTQTALNETLQTVFPGARNVYYEHGLGDYYYFYHRIPGGKFIGFFGQEFQKFSNRNSVSLVKSIQLGDGLVFDDAMQKFHHLISSRLEWLRGGACAIFLMDALEGYNPPEHFWTDYLEMALNRSQLPHDCVLLVKPHPNQSNGVMQITSDWLKKNNINHVFLSDPEFVSLSVEVIFSYLKKEVICLISTFSSAIFYLAKFYPEKCRFLLMYDFVKPFTKNAPKQYIDHFNGLKPLIDDVFMQPNIERVE